MSWHFVVVVLLVVAALSLAGALLVVVSAVVVADAEAAAAHRRFGSSSRRLGHQPRLHRPVWSVPKSPSVPEVAWATDEAARVSETEHPARYRGPA